MNIREIKKAIDISGVTTVIINKVDVMREVGHWNLRAAENNALFMQLGSEEGWKSYIRRYLGTGELKVLFSESPEEI